MDSKITDFIEEVKKEEYDNYCVVVYYIREITNQKFIKYIYKSLEDFILKIEKDIEKIDPMYGIQFQIWEYD